MNCFSELTYYAHVANYGRLIERTCNLCMDNIIAHQFTDLLSENKHANVFRTESFPHVQNSALLKLTLVTDVQYVYFAISLQLKTMLN